MYFEVVRSKMVEVWLAVVKLTRALNQYIEQLEANIDIEGGETLTMAQLTYVDPAWKPLLETILHNVRLFINVPTALGSGHQALPDKVAAEAYKMHLRISAEKSVRREADTIRWHTSDMGTEVGLPGFYCQDHEKLLPNWVERGETQRDVDGLNAPDEDELEMGPDVNVDDDVERGDEGGPRSEGDERGPRGVGDEGGPRAVGDEGGPRAVQPPVPDIENEEFLRYAFGFAGVQHVADNANADSDKSMCSFEEFFKELKLTEALLGEGYRRERFCWTCLRKTPYKSFEKAFESFPASLYEPRWHEVMSYLKVAKKHFRILVLTFDAHKYNSGLDADGQKLETAQTRARKERAAGKSEFDAVKFESVIRRGSFHGMCNCVEVVNRLPFEFAKSCEVCPCHARLFKHLNAYQVQLVLNAHYGSWVNCCPMGGKVIPKLVAGGLEDLFDELANRGVAEITTYEPPHGATVISANEQADIVLNFQQGARSGFTILRLKNDYIFRPPVNLAGLAVENEEEARKYGLRARATFLKDPRKAAHDSRTWRLMQPGCIFRESLDKFLDDPTFTRESLPSEFLFEVAVFALGMAPETLIEQRHAIATLALKKHFLGPVRLSLSNRLPMVERWIRLGFFDGLDLLNAFSKTRELMKAPDVFGVGLHPRISSVTHPAEMRVGLTKVIYRCEIMDMFRSQSAAKEHHDRRKRKSTYQDAKLIEEKTSKEDLTFQIVKRTAMDDHVRAQMQGGGGNIFSCPARYLQMVSLEALLDTPRTKQPRISEPQAEAFCDIEAEGDHIDDAGTIYFEPVWRNIGKKRTMRVAVGAGQHLKDADVSVYLHADFVKQADGTVRFVSGGNDKDSNYIYRGISDDQSLSLEDVESSFQVWHPQSKWMIPLRGCDTLEVSDLLQRLMDKNASPNQESKAYDKKVLNVMKAYENRLITINQHKST